MSLIETNDANDPIGRVIDRLSHSSGIHVDWRKAIYAEIDKLRERSGPKERIDTAERISIALLQLDWAILRGDKEKEDKARKSLASLGNIWRSMSDPTRNLESVSLEEVLEPCEVESITAEIERIIGRR